MSLADYFIFDTLAMPEFLLLLPLVLIVFVLECAGRTPGHITISTGDTLMAIAPGPRRWIRHAPALIRGAGLAALVVALAGPLRGFEINKDRAGIRDIFLCVDVSGSMGEMDYFVGGDRQDRLYVTKGAVRDFVENRKARRGDRQGLDRIGLVLYAGYAWTQSPLSLDYAVLERELERAQVTTDQRKDGTAIGSALGLAVRRLSGSAARSKVIVLLTDGLNNAGELNPITAAQIAAQYGVRVYTIGAGLPSALETRQPIDEEGLRKIAEITGGRYFRATDTAALQQAYSEISALETTEADAQDYYAYREGFVPWAVLGGLSVLAAILMRRAWFEVLP